MEINGTIKVIFDKQTFDSGFEKREFVVTTEEQYPQDIKLELFNDKTNLIDAYNSGDKVQVAFNIRGNEYNGKYFVNLNAWKISLQGQNQATNEPPVNEVPLPSEEPSSSIDYEDDDLPF